MTDDRRRFLKLVSVCLGYPDAALFATLPEVATAAGSFGPAERGPVADFADRLAAIPPLAAQEHWTSVFDLNPATSLNLTWHRLKDTENRARALAALVDVYREAGFDPATEELPDYLPLVLEFLAQIPPESEHPEPLADCLQALPELAGRLKESGSIYAPLVALAAEIAEPAPASGVPRAPVAPAPGGHA